eukprot:6144403-Lingulodinium_polyedra.AAC.1
MRGKPTPACTTDTQTPRVGCSNRPLGWRTPARARALNAGPPGPRKETLNGRWGRSAKPAL